MSNLSEKAVLMRFSAGVPGEERQDPRVTEDVKRDKAFGADAGKWEKRLYPKEALAAVKAKITEARDYHNSVTLPYDMGTGILPGTLIMEYTDKMRDFANQLNAIVEDTFLKDPQKWIDWARAQHNGSFECKNYPGCKAFGFDPDVFRSAMRKKFYLRTEPSPVPASEHFCNTVASLLGTDTASVDQRVAEAQIEGQREVLKRLLQPVKHMVETLTKDKPRIYETLIGNIRDICKIAPKLNLSGDIELDNLITEVERLTMFETTSLKDSADKRTEARKAAEAVLAKLSGYKI